MNRKLSVMLAVVLAISLFAVLAFAQSPAAQKPAGKATSTAWKMPRTADGHPDFTGFYSSAQSIPVARPQNLGAKEFYTEEEMAAQAARARNAKEVGLHYDNAQFGLTAGQTKVALSKRTSMIIGPTGRVPELTPEAQKIVASRRSFQQEHQWDGPETRPLAERCITWGFEGPPMMPVGYNSNLQLVNGVNSVSVVQEMIHDTRVIPTDNSAHAPAKIKSWMGDSRGRWEGDVLVVETTNYNDRLTIQGGPSSDTLKVTERFSLVGPGTVKYEFTVNDPKIWTAPWSGEYLMTQVDTPVYEYACHEGNYGMANILSSRRATEAKEAADKKK